MYERVWIRLKVRVTESVSKNNGESNFSLWPHCIELNSVLKVDIYLTCKDRVTAIDYVSAGVSIYTL